MLKFLLVSAFDEYDEEESPGAIPTEFCNSQTIFLRNLLTSLKDDKPKLFILSKNGEGALLPFSPKNQLDGFQYKDIVFKDESLRNVFYILTVDMIDHHKNISYVWEAIQSATSDGSRISALGPTDEINGEAMLAQQGFQDGEMDTGYFTSDDPDEAVVSIHDLPSEIAHVWDSDKLV